MANRLTSNTVAEAPPQAASKDAVAGNTLRYANNGEVSFSDERAEPIP